MVVQFGVVSLDYFMDKMKPYELSIITDKLHLRVKDSWEQSRLIAYMVGQVNSKKKLKPTDIIKFGWESEDTPQQQQHTLSIDEVEKIKLMALEREKMLKEKGII